jgi:hypothetical protein
MCEYCATHHQTLTQPVDRFTRMALTTQHAEPKPDPNAGNKVCDLCGKVSKVRKLNLPTPTVVTGRRYLRICTTHTGVTTPSMKALERMVYDLPQCPLCNANMDPDQPRCSCGGRNWLTIMEIM